MTALCRTAAVPITFAAVGLASACTATASREAPAPRPVRVEGVAEAPGPTAIRYSATIDAVRQVPLAFKTAGYVERVVEQRGADGRLRTAQAGDRITSGTVLARVEDTEYRDRVGPARARRAEAEAGRTRARADVERARTLFASDSLTRPDLDSAEAAFAAAAARVTAGESDVALAERALGDVALVAPASGVLLERRIEVGSLVGTGTVGFVLADVSAVKARVGVPDHMLRAVAPGAALDVTIDALAGATFPGRVTALAPVADPQSRVFDVEVTIPNREGRLRPGMIGSVAFAPASGMDAAAAGLLTVPLSAVVRPESGDGAYAVVVVGRRGGAELARLRTVELGDVVGNGVTVTRGLTRGDRIVVTGAGLLVDGEAVRVIP
ncbi:MAG: efflux RND transporter periplasmic adaptor subunit [Vicinamibacterales bacterium]